MKRSELTVGMVVAVGRLDGANSNIRKATVVKTSADRAGKYSWGVKPLLGGVMVQYESSMIAMGNTAPNDIVTLAQVVGPWDETHAKVQEWRNEALKRTLTAEQMRTETRLRAEEAVAGLRALGFEGARVEYTLGCYRVTMSPTEAKNLVGRLNA